jgi:RND family efflux transporter MFP subunit
MKIHEWKLYIAALCLLTGAGCSQEPSTSPSAPETVSGLRVVSARRSEIPDTAEMTGTVRAVRVTTVASQMTGTVIDVRVVEGARVEKDQVLAVIDDAEPRAVLDAATAAALAAEKEIVAADAGAGLAAATLKRYQQLFENRSVSPQEFEEVRARYETAQARRETAQAEGVRADAEVARMRTALGHAQVRTPFSGLVTAKMVETGALAAPGVPLFTVEDTRSYRLEITVNEADMLLARVGQTATISLDALGEAEFPGRIVEVVPAADPGSRSFVARAQLPLDRRLRSGLFGRARMVRGQRTALTIPAAAVVRRGQLEAVYAVESGDLASLRYVTVGGSAAGDQVEVLAGVGEGDRLIADPGGRELAGKRVVIQP